MNPEKPLNTSRQVAIVMGTVLGLLALEQAFLSLLLYSI